MGRLPGSDCRTVARNSGRGGKARRRGWSERFERGRRCWPRPSTGGEVVARELADSADCVLETVPRAEVVCGEDADHDALAGALEHSYVVADIRKEVAGFVRDPVAREV